MSTVLVTGGSGLLGWPVVECLVRDGHAVTVYDLEPGSANLDGIRKHAEIVAGDVMDLPGLLRVVKTRRIERIVHLAAYTARASEARPSDSVVINVQGLANVLDIAEILGLGRVVWASSVAAVNVASDYRGPPADETFRSSPRTTYGIAKLACESVSEAYRARGVDVVGIRPPLAFGLGRLTGRTGDFNAAVRNVARGEPATLDFAIADRPAQLIYNRDMARLFVAALTATDSLAPLYNTPVDRDHPWTEVRDILRALVPGCEVSIRARPAGESSAPLMDGALARRDLAFEPRYSLEEALAEMITRFRK